MRNTILSILLTLVMAATVGVAGFVGFTWTQLKAAEIRNQAIDGCAQIAVNTFTSNGDGQTNVISDLNLAVYEKCLQLKGVTATK